MNRKANSTVLLVDDDKRVLRSLKVWLTSEGFDTLTASNGTDAVTELLNNPVDAAVLDFRIGREDGIDVAQKLKELDEDLRVIILTGFPSYETAVQAMKIGAYDYLSKSAPNDTIIETIRKAAAERQLERVAREKDANGDKRTKIVLFCNHSLIKERLENYSRSSIHFKLVKSFPMVNPLLVKNVPNEVAIALVCAGCNIRAFTEAYTVFPQLYRTIPGVKPLLINHNFSDREMVELLRLGVRGFCSLESGVDALEKAILNVARGELWVSRRVTQLSLSELVPHESFGVSGTTLSSPVYASPATHPQSPPAPAVGNDRNHGPGPEHASPPNRHDPQSVPGIHSQLKQKNADAPTPVSEMKKLYQLTSKEKQVLKKITKGLKNKEIAIQLAITETTVKTHINRILKKLGVDCRTKAVLMAMEKKIV